MNLPKSEMVLVLPLSHGNGVNIIVMVRSTLLPPAGGRQIAYGPILLLGDLDPLCPMLSRAQVHDFIHSRYEPPLFLTLFPMVSTPLLSDDGNPWNTLTFGTWVRNDEKLMFPGLIKEYSGDV